MSFDPEALPDALIVDFDFDDPIEMEELQRGKRPSEEPGQQQVKRTRRQPPDSDDEAGPSTSSAPPRSRRGKERMRLVARENRRRTLKMGSQVDFSFGYEQVVPVLDTPFTQSLVGSFDDTPALPLVSNCNNGPDAEVPTWPPDEEASQLRDTVYYAYLSRFEPGPNRELAEVRLECIEAASFDELLDLPAEDFWRDHGEFRTWRVALDPLPCKPTENPRRVGKIDLVPPPSLGYAKTLQEMEWYRIHAFPWKVEGGAHGTAQFFPGTEKQPEFDVWITWIEAISDERVVDALDRFFAIQPPKEVQHAGTINATLGFVGALNVGQGGCNALFDTDGHPFLYYDLGRANSQHERPPGAARRPCMHGNPTVVLSHWNDDHFELPLDFEPACDLPWLVPEQYGDGKNAGRLGTWGGKLYTRLSRVRLWPWGHKRFEEYSWGFIVRCDGEDWGDGGTNGTGLALLVRVQNDPAAPPVGQRAALDDHGARPQIFPEERYVVLTGDAMFHFVPSCREGDLHGKVVAILAPHHGAQTHIEGNAAPLAWAAIPRPAPLFNGLPPAVIYTYGIDRQNRPRKYHQYNRYGHPGLDAVAMYSARGYHRRLNTVTRTGDAANGYADHRNCIMASRHDAQFAAGSAAARNLEKAQAAYEALLRQADPAIDSYDAFLLAFKAVLDAGANFGTAAQNAYNAATLVRPAVTVADRNHFTNVTLPAVNLAGTKEAAVAAMRASLLSLELRAGAWANQCAAAAAEVVEAAQPPVRQAVRCAGANLGLQPTAPVGNAPVAAPHAPSRVSLAAAPDGTNDQAFAGESARLLALGANQTIVRHPGHNLGGVTAIAVGASPGGYLDGLRQATPIDGDHYSLPVAHGAPPAVAEIRIGLRPATILESAPHTRIVEHPGHNQANGASVAVDTGGGPVNHTITFIDNGHYAIPAADATATSVTPVVVEGKPIAVLTTAANTCLIHHRRHGLVNGATIVVRGAESVDFQGVNDTVFTMTRIDDDHYTIPHGPLNPGLETDGNVCGTFVDIVSTAANTAIVREELHGRANASNVTISGATTGPFNGVKQITVLDLNHYRIAAAGAGAAQRLEPAHAGAAAARVIEVAADALLVHHPGRAFAVNHAGAFANGAVNGQNLVLTSVQPDHSTVPAGAVAGPIADATVTVDGHACTLFKTLPNTRIVVQSGHGKATGDEIRIHDGPLKGPYSITRLDNDHYSIPLPALLPNAIAAATAAGTAVQLYKTTPGRALVKQTAHGLASGHRVVIGGAAHGAFNGVHPVLVVDPDHFSIPVARGAATVDGATVRAGAATATLLAAAANVTIVHHPNHRLRAGANVTVSPTGGGGGTFQAVNGARAIAAVLDANHYTIAAGPNAANVDTGATIAGTRRGTRRRHGNGVLPNANAATVQNAGSVAAKSARFKGGAAALAWGNYQAALAACHANVDYCILLNCTCAGVATRGLVHKL